MIRFLISKMAGKNASGKLLVFNYHNILVENTPAYARGTNFKQFKRQIDWLQANFDLQPLEAALGNCRAGSLERPTACITFDDGYKTQSYAAAAYLKSKGISATFFVTSGHFDDSLLWNDWLRIFFGIAAEKEWATLTDILNNATDSPIDTLGPKTHQTIEDTLKYLSLDARRPILEYIRSVVPADYDKQGMMSRADVKRLHMDGFEIGAHSLSHPILTKEDPKIASEQIAVDIENVSEVIGSRVTCFAFPNGKPGIDFDADHILMLVRNRIRFGLTSALGYFSAGQDPMQISRVCLRGSSETGFVRSIRQAYHSPPNMVRSRGYESLR